MLNSEQAEALRREIARLSGELHVLQEDMVRPRRMLAASLIERHLGTRTSKRVSTAYYLSWAHDGSRGLRYVPKDELTRVSTQVECWREYRRELRHCRRLASRLLTLLKQLGDAQADHGGGAQR